MNTVTDLPTTMTFSALPALRAALAGGIFIGVTTLADGRHVAAVHLANADKRRSQQRQTEWAAELGGVLASPAIFQMLIDNAPDLVPKGWNWTSKVEGSSDAWYCNLPGGYQGYTGRSAEGGAVAVSLIPLTL